MKARDLAEVCPAELRHSPESEKAVLACVLLEPGRFDEVLLHVEPEDIHQDRVRLIFRAMLRVREAALPIDIRTLQEDLERRGELEAAGGVAAIASLDNDLPDIGRCEAYCRIVRRDSLARQAARLARQALSRLASVGEPGDVRDELAGAHKLLDESVGVDVGYATMTEMLVTGRARLEAIRSGERKPGLRIGYPSIDRGVVGLAPRDLMVVGGYAGEGKTTLVEDLLWRWVGWGERVAFVSLEMSRDQEETRAIARLVRTPLTATAKGQFPFDQLDAFIGDPKRQEESDRFVCAFPRSSRLELVIDAARMIQSDHHATVLVVDHIHRITAPISDRRLEVDRIVRDLKQLAVELEIPIVAPAQTGRDGRRSGRRPQISDLYESAACEQEADVILMVYRPDQTEPLEVSLQKSRQGETVDWLPLAFDPRTRTLSEIDNRYPAPPPGRASTRAPNPW